jgi:hypothetical protein
MVSDACEVVLQCRLLELVDFGLMARLQSSLIQKQNHENDAEGQKLKHREDCSGDESLLRVAEVRKSGCCRHFVRLGALVDCALNVIERRVNDAMVESEDEPCIAAIDRGEHFARGDEVQRVSSQDVVDNEAIPWIAQRAHRLHGPDERIRACAMRGKNVLLRLEAVLPVEGLLRGDRISCGLEALI